MIMFYIWAGLAMAAMLFTLVTAILLCKEVMKILEAWIGVTCGFFLYTIFYLFYILFTSI